ncbi:hypothetical protein [uncultured Amphritea sp.]|uniref:hypothetical protein n=1 Tax=uncultured Amphritea sp. TaxID=981605 RepID=UPI00260DDBEA|nr:hypothetical protein [uncultured Amphritea sp.]
MNTTFQTLLRTSVVALSIASQTAISAPQLSWSLEGFDEPESVLVHPTQPLLFVSNMNGSPTELNGKGYISLLSSEGRIIRHVWVNGMNAPKGMAMDAQYLYVADMQQLHIIDIEQGVLVKSVKAASSKMLNDVTIDDKGVVYISDLLGGGLYRYMNNTLSQWITAEQLPHPNGLIFREGKLIVATWGEGLKEDFSTETPGGLFAVTPETATLTPYKDAQQFGNLDGVTAMGDSLLISDWMNGNIFEFKNAAVHLLFNAGKHSADIAAKGDQLYVPMMFSQRIDAYKIKH